MLQDVYPDGLIALHRLRSDGVIARTWHALNKLAFCAAREIWVLGRDMKMLVRDKYGEPCHKIRYVPHWSPIDIDRPIQAEKTRLWRRLALDGKFVIQYSGNMGLWHDINTIIEAAARLRSVASIHFLFIGSGIKRSAAEKQAAELRLPNVTWLPYQPREELRDSLACCHAALVSQMAGLEGVAVPCKLYGILASGRAVIAQVPAVSEVALVVTEENCGLVVPEGDSRALAVAIEQLADNRIDTKRMGDAAFAAYRRQYTLQSGIDAFHRGWEAWTKGGEVGDGMLGVANQ